MTKNNIDGVKKDGKAVIVLGMPASGKSSNAIDKYVEDGYFNLDNDEVKKLFTEYDNGLGANNVHEASSYVATDLVLPELVAQKANTVIPVIGKGLKSLENYAKILKDGGYNEITLLDVDLPLDKTATRNFTRMLETSRNVSMDYIYDAVGNKPTENYNLIKERIDNGTEPSFTNYAKISTDVEFGAPAKMLENSGEVRIPGLDDRNYATGTGTNGRYDSSQGTDQGMVYGRENNVSVKPETEIYNTFTNNKTSKEYEYRQKANQALLDQYGTVDAPTSRATKPIETVEKIANAGFTKPQEVESAINKITGTNGEINN